MSRERAEPRCVVPLFYAAAQAVRERAVAVSIMDRMMELLWWVMGRSVAWIWGCAERVVREPCTLRCYGQRTGLQVIVSCDLIGDRVSPSKRLLTCIREISMQRYAHQIK